METWHPSLDHINPKQMALKRVSQMTSLSGLSEIQGHLQFPGPRFSAVHSIYSQPMQCPMWVHSNFHLSKDIPIKLIVTVWQQTHSMHNTVYEVPHRGLCVFLLHRKTNRGAAMHIYLQIWCKCKSSIYWNFARPQNIRQCSAFRLSIVRAEQQLTEYILNDGSI